MKKIILLISLCLLSQGYTIASENVERGEFSYAGNTVYITIQRKTYAGPPPVSKLKAKPLSEFSQFKQENDDEIITENQYIEQVQKTAENIVQQPSVVQQQTQLSTQLQIPSSSNQQTTQNGHINNVETQGFKPLQQKTLPKIDITNQQEVKVVEEVIIPDPYAKKQNYDIKNTVHKTVTAQPQETNTAISEYIETTPEQEKYKQKNKKHLNLWAEKKQNKAPIIVEDNLSQPTDANEVRARITKVEFPDSKVFTQEELQQLAAPLLKQPVTFDDIQKVVNGITRCYILGDYATSKAYLPPQDISNGVLKIGLFEGTIGKISINDNRWTKTGYIENRLNFKEDDLLKISVLEEDIIKFNNNNTLKLKAELSASEEQGKTDITLNAIEDFPFHIAFMTDNQGRQSIGRTRWGTMLAADSLFGHRDKLSLGGYLGHGNRVGFIDYNFPLNKYGTRLGASVSAGNISVINGPMKAYGVGGTSQVYSAYLTHPLIDSSGFNISSYTAGNIKHSTTDISGYKLFDTSTFSVTQGFTAKKDTEKGIWYTGHFGSAGFKALSGDEDFFKYEGNITRLHDFGHGIIGQFRISGQYSPDSYLPWMEQFQIGGLSTVRGYSEGLLLGRSGYFASAEIMTPLPFLPKAIGSDKLGYIYPREMIKGAVFMDNGMIFPYKTGDAIDSGDLLMSWGLGLRVNLAKDLAARFYWGFGLKNKYEIDNKFGRFHFELTCAPDIGKVVAKRNPAKNKSSKKNKKENL